MKIPLYNKGVGATGITAGGSLGPRATSGAFTGVGQQLAAFGKEADRIATDFFDAEAQSVADDANVKAGLEYKSKIAEFNRTNGSLSVAEYDKKFEQFKNIELNIARGKYKLRKDFQQKFDNNLEIIAANGKQLGRQETHTKGTKIKAQNSQDYMNSKIDDLVATKDPILRERILADINERTRLDLANGYTPYVKYKTADAARKEADKRGLFIDINDEDKSLDDLQKMKSEILDPKNEKYAGYSAGERETFNAKIQDRINFLRTGVTAQLEQDYINTKSYIKANPDKADEHIEQLELQYNKLGIEGKNKFVAIKLELQVLKTVEQRSNSYNFESPANMQSELLDQKNKWESSSVENSAKELAIYQGMQKKFAGILQSRKTDVVDYIKRIEGQDVTRDKLLAIQSRMGIPPKDRKLKTQQEMTKFFEQYDSLAPSEASAFLKQSIEDEGSEKNLLVKQMMQSGLFGAHENLTMINPLSSLNNTFIAAKKGDKTIKEFTTATDRTAMNQLVIEKFSDFRASHVGTTVMGSVLGAGGRDASINEVQMAIAKTAHYIKATNKNITDSDAVERAMNIIDSSYVMRKINGGFYRMKNEIVQPDDQGTVHDSLKKIIDNRRALKDKIQLPENKSFETYITQAGRQLRWQTNEEEDGVFLVNSGAHDTFVLDKSGKKIEYKFADLITKTQQTAADKDKKISQQTKTRLEKRQRQLGIRNKRLDE